MLAQAREFMKTGKHHWRRKSDYERWLKKRFPGGIPEEESE